jgi:ubiquinone/menaquinone biosynthesis C-methylase UbiE
MTGETWHSVWERKGAAQPIQETYSQDELFAVNGYDTPTGITSVRGRQEMLRNIIAGLGVSPGRSLLEVGCGSGAILAMLRDKGAHLTGVDFSASLVEIARQSLDGIDIRVAEAGALPFASGQFDMVLSHGVFLYFADFQYASAALREIFRVCRRAARFLIGDIPDLEKKESCLAARRAAGASLTPEHLYYPKSFFKDFATVHSLRVAISDQDIPDYANSRFRFNVLFEKS